MVPFFPMCKCNDSVHVVSVVVLFCDIWHFFCFIVYFHEQLCVSIWTIQFSIAVPNKVQLLPFKPCIGFQIETLPYVTRHSGAVPHHGGHHLCQWNCAGGGTHLHCAMGHNVDYDAARETWPKTFPSHALPTIWWWRTSVRLWWQFAGHWASWAHSGFLPSFVHPQPGQSKRDRKLFF